MQIILSILNYIAEIAKYTSSVLFVAAVVAAVYYYNRFAASVYGFLKKFGLSRWDTMLVTFACRKDWVNNARMFMEFSIFATHGLRVDRKKWKEIRSIFISKYIKSLYKTRTVKIENTFVIVNEDIKEAIAGYFEHISKKHNIKRFAIQDLKHLSFITDIEIEEGYIVPLMPITSLQKRYNADWSKILSSYVRTYSNYNEGGINPNELYSFYTWLMWGPSVQVSGQDSEYKLCEYGLGDESMSVPVVLPNSGEAGALWQDLMDIARQNELGAFIKGKFKICESVSYFKENACMFGTHCSIFADSISRDREENPCVLEYLSHSVNNKLEASNCLFSAYLWIMLYYTDSENATGFDCNNTAVWFEHANVSDRDNTKFLKDRLIEKIINHLEQVWENKNYNNRKYHIVWALNDNFEKELQDRIIQLRNDASYKYSREFSERFNFESHISPSMILSSIDNNFDDNEISVNFTKIDFSDDKHLGLLAKFYCGLYIKEFPDKNERESLDNIIAQAERLNDNKEANYYCIIASRGENIVGGIIGDYFPKSNSGAIEYIVVSPKERGRNLGRGLIDKLRNFMDGDARLSGYKHLGYFFFEVEDPSKMLSETDKKLAEKRLGFWSKMSSRKIAAEYVQPPLDDDKEAAENLSLMILPTDSGINTKAVNAKEVYSFLRNYFKYAMDIKDEAVLDKYLQNFNPQKIKEFELI